MAAIKTSPFTALAALGAVAAVSAAAPALAAAATPASITACVNAKTGALVIKKTCAKGQRKLLLTVAGATVFACLDARSVGAG